MILLVVLGILVATLFFLEIVVNTSLYYNVFTRVSPYIFMVASLLSVVLNFKIDTSNKTQSVIYKNPQDAKVEIVATHEREILTFTVGYDHTKITAGDTITQDKLDYLKENTDSAKVTISKGKESSTRNNADLEFKDLNKKKPGMKAKLEKVTYSTADKSENIFGQKGLTWSDKTITVYVRYIDSNSQKELDDLYGDNK
mgnify:FL=1